MNAQETIESFLRGEMDIISFRKLYDENAEINDFLQGIVDDAKAKGAKKLRGYPKTLPNGVEFEQDHNVSYLLNPSTFPGVAYGNSPYDSVRKMLTHEHHMETHDVRGATGASTFYNEVYALYYQVDQSIPHEEKYHPAFRFALDVIPEYLMGGESELYINTHILPLYPDTMKKTERIKAIKAGIKEAFRSDKGRPQWIQSGEWPLGKDGKPAVYTGSKKLHGGEMKHYFFRDESDGSIITVEQFY
ncbi:MAG: hypothetical protein IJ438_04245 [Clostridia bacterium]|nr:hypothetical protein [Clostridia bacterium]